MKFGGTSVKDKNAIERVISIVRGRMADKPLVVVSALAKVTRVLCSIAEEAEAQHLKEVDELLDSLRDRHTSLAVELLSGNPEILNNCVSEVNAVLDSLTDFAHGVCQIGELSPRSYARIVSTGEVLSSKIVAAAMNVYGLSCRWLDARKMIVTDCSYMSAVPDLAATEANVKRFVPEAAKGVSVVLTQGFIASSVEGSPSVLGFEGSDYSAAIFGMALDADRIEIWTDVDGIQSADPRKIADTHRIDRVSYDEASEMAYLGARVLHPLTIEPARRRNIPVHVLNSMSPDAPGSVVTHECVAVGPKTVAVKDDIDYLEITSPKIVGVTAMFAGVFNAAETNAVKVVLAAASESKVGVTLESGQPGFEAFVQQLRKKFEVMVYKDKVEISVVGNAVVTAPGLVDKMTAAASGANVYMMSQSPSMLSISIVVDRSAAVDIAGRIHKVIF